MADGMAKIMFQLFKLKQDERDKGCFSTQTHQHYSRANSDN